MSQKITLTVDEAQSLRDIARSLKLTDREALKYCIDTIWEFECLPPQEAKPAVEKKLPGRDDMLNKDD